MTALYLVGPMACGKSSVMAAILDLLGLGTGDWFKIWPTTHNEFRGEPLEDVITGEARGLYLGIHRGDFSGTDAIGMASHSEAMAWLEEADELPELVLGEGQRLGTVGFLAGLNARMPLTVGHLTAPQEVLNIRRELRWANQEASYKSGRVVPKDSFVKGTHARATNAANGAREAGACVLELDTSELDPRECAEKLVASIFAKPLAHSRDA